MAQLVGLLWAWICLLHSAVGMNYEDGECVFPFQYENKMFYDCIKFKAKHKWCSVNATYEGYWKYCARDDFAKCVFPFWYRRMIYWECTDDGHKFGKKWCSLTKNYNKDQVWKFC
ncbi:binder of sperm protein homolog 1-like [Cynocephalus volans]|uniref:binder of sperm protein homolog 1-like n=1 Tax=Cynocephalus volans TaxID=110931 RepID=UPI002FCC17A5